MYWRNRFCFGLVVITLVVVFGCRYAPANSPPAASPQPTAVLSTATPALPTSTVPASPASPPGDTADCNPNAVLARLKQVFPYAEFSLTYNNIVDLRALTVWYVDPEIETGEDLVDFKGTLDSVLQNAASLSHHLVALEPCIVEAFTHIDLIVVDSRYSGWFSGLVATESVSVEDQLSERDLERLVDELSISYLREEGNPMGELSSSSSCDWADVAERLALHFDPARQNVGFMHIINANNRDVNAFWDGPELSSDLLMPLTVSSLLNVALELQCFDPPIDKLTVNVLSENGDLLLIGELPQQGIASFDLEQFTILYEAPAANEAVVVNRDGFDCAVAMATNVLADMTGSDAADILCEDVGQFFERDGGVEDLDYQDAQRFVAAANEFYNANDLPYKIEVIQDTSRTYLLQNFQQSDAIYIVAVETPQLLQALVVVGYDAGSAEFLFLDSLARQNPTDEADFYSGYLTEFLDVWKTTFRIYLREN